MLSKVFTLRKYEENEMPFSLALQSNLSLPFVTTYLHSLIRIILIRQTKLFKTDI